MPASDVRLTVLATVMLLEPVTGYAVRKHLLEQGIQAWAGTRRLDLLRPGYAHAPRAARGARRPHGVRHKIKAYRLTDAGHREFLALWNQAIARVDPGHPVGFHVAITLTALVTDTQYIDALRRRVNALETTAHSEPDPPAQVAHAARLRARLRQAEIDWLHETIETVQCSDHGFDFADAASAPTTSKDMVSTVARRAIARPDEEVSERWQGESWCSRGST